MQKMELLLTLAIFLCGAIICLFGAAFHLTWIAPLFVLPFAAIYFLFSRPTIANIKLSLCIFVIGYTANALLKLFGLLSFSYQGFSLGQIPLWLICFLILFAVLFPTLFSSIKKYWTPAIIGTIGGPLYYFTAYQLGVLYLNPQIYMSLILIAVAWALMLCIFIKLRESLMHSQTTI